MKSFQAVIIAAILAAAAAANEPVASPTFFKQELTAYEHQLRNLQGSVDTGGDRGEEVTSAPTPARAPSRPTPGSMSYSSVSMSYYGGKGGKSGGGKGGKSGTGSYSYSTSMSYGSGKGGKSGTGSGKGGKSGTGSYSYSASMSNDYNYGNAAGDAKATKRQ